MSFCALHNFIKSACYGGQYILTSLRIYFSAPRLAYILLSFIYTNICTILSSIQYNSTVHRFKKKSKELTKYFYI